MKKLKVERGRRGAEIVGEGMFMLFWLSGRDETKIRGKGQAKNHKFTVFSLRTVIPDKN
jgi:hypothetical protein